MKYTDPDGRWTDKMKVAIENHLDEKYVSDVNDCDIWVQKVEKEAHPNSILSTIWGDAKTTNAAGHAKNLDESLNDFPELGTNIALQYKNDKAIHAFLVAKNPDGSYDLAQCTKNPEGGKKEDGSGYSENLHYNSYEEMIDGWGKLKFYSLNDASISDKLQAWWKSGNRNISTAIEIVKESMQ